MKKKAITFSCESVWPWREGLTAESIVLSFPASEVDRLIKELTIVAGNASAVNEPIDESYARDKRAIETLWALIEALKERTR
jgi:hypothetical protein